MNWPETKSTAQVHKSLSCIPVDPEERRQALAGFREAHSRQQGPQEPIFHWVPHPENGRRFLVIPTPSVLLFLTVKDHIGLLHSGSLFWSYKHFFHL